MQLNPHGIDFQSDRREEGDLRSGSDLAALTLETTNALLSPLGSHLRRLQERLVNDAMHKTGAQLDCQSPKAREYSQFLEDEEMVARSHDEAEPATSLCVWRMTQQPLRASETPLTAIGANDVINTPAHTKIIIIILILIN